jgi:two-component system, OmpR family, response regulator
VPPTVRENAATTKILVVDDEDNIRFLLRTALSHAGYEVVEAYDGKGAVAAVVKHEPDLVLLDVMMPDFDGFEVLRRIRTNGIETPVIFLTARDGLDDQVSGLTNGADDYIVKPFRLEAVLARVQVQLRRTQGRAIPQTLCYADITINDSRHEVTRGDDTIELSATEYKVLHFLVSNAERVVSKTQILHHVWKYDFDGDSSIVESYISFLRRKLDDGRVPLIKTVRGVGYTLRT